MKGVFLCGCTTNAAGSKANGAVFRPGPALKTGGDTTGRNHKIGLEWWPRDIGLFRDPKLRSVRQEFGVLGPYIYECLLDIAYGDKGYYISYSGRGREDVLWQLSEYVAGRYAVPAETIANVIDRLVECELFSGDLYKRGFITSKRMQMLLHRDAWAQRCAGKLRSMAAERGGNAGKEPERQVISAAILYFLARKTYFPAGNGYFSAGKYTEQRTVQQSRKQDSRGQYSTAEDSRAEECGERTGD